MRYAVSIFLKIILIKLYLKPTFEPVTTLLAPKNLIFMFQAPYMLTLYINYIIVI
jgi:hypothetical protein